MGTGEALGWTPGVPRQDARHPPVWGVQNGPTSSRMSPERSPQSRERCLLGPRGAQPPAGSGGRLPRCITRRECMCSTALHSCAKYFQTVLSGMSRFCFLKYCSGEDRQAWVTGHKGGDHGAVPLSCPQR